MTKRERSSSAAGDRRKMESPKSSKVEVGNRTLRGNGSKSGYEDWIKAKQRIAINTKTNG